MRAFRTIALALVLGIGVAMPASAQHAVADDAQVSTFDSEIAAAKGAMMANPEVALQHARLAGSLAATAAQLSPEIALATARWLEGEALTRLNRPNDSEPIIAEALATVVRVAPGTKLNGDLLMSRANIAGVTGRVQEALQDFQEAHKIFQAVGAARSQAIALQNIGSIYNDAGDYERVLSYYEQSAEVYREDEALSLAAHNNRGNAFKELGQLDKAEHEFRQALELAKSLDSPLLQVRILTNIASAQFLQGKRDAAEETAVAALEIAKDRQAEGWAPFLWGVRAQVALANGDLAKAESHIGHTFEGLDLAATTMPFRDFHKTAYEIFKARGENGKALKHLEAYKRLDDEAQTVMASTTAALMSAQFDYANQQLRISTLKAGSLQSEKELADSRSALRTTVAFGVIGAASIIVLLTMVGFFKIRRSRNETHAANVRLNLANMALEKAVKARTEFLAMTSHEIRTPLNGILGMAQVMLMDPAIEGETRSNVEVVYGAGQTMKALVDDILDVAKMESGKLILESHNFDLKSALAEIGALAKAQGEAKGLKVIVDQTACPVRAVGDEQRLRQIIFNLMSNAVKFTERGEVRLTAIGDAANQELRIAVSDTGIGIAAEHIERIFQSFQQVDATISRRYGGTGLGLAICDNLARAMGGRIDVTSEPGKGSTFTVTLPLALSETPAEAQMSADTGENSVLVADGNLLRQSLCAAELRKAGFEVAEADSPAEVDAAIGARKFALLVVAAPLLETETLDGLMRLRALRAAQPNARLIVLAEDGARSTLIGCGADDVIPLSISPSALPTFIFPAAAKPDESTMDCKPVAVAA